MDQRAALYDLRLLGQSLTPSIFSTICCIVLTALLVGGLVLDVRLKDSLLHVIFFDWSNMTIADGGDTTFAIVMQDLSNKASAFVVWALFGLFIVTVVGGVYEVVRRLRSLNDELNNSYVSRKTILLEALKRFGIRAVTLMVWAFYIWAFFVVIIPYVVAASLVGAVTFPTLEGVGYLVVAVLIVGFSLHIHVVFLRILLLHPRVFGGADYLLSAQ